jgi:hypothetical protein
MAALGLSPMLRDLRDGDLRASHSVALGQAADILNLEFKRRTAMTASYRRC